MTKPQYIYVASSWRNSVQPGVCEMLSEMGIEHYDFKNPPGGTGFSWKQVKPDDTVLESITVCEHCNRPIVYSTFAGLGRWEPDFDAAGDDPLVWRHTSSGYAACGGSAMAAPKKGSDWESAEVYRRMLLHPRAQEGFEADFGAMERADTMIMVLPCGKSAHLELGWACGAGKQVAILMEDPIEPELMYLCTGADATNLVGSLNELRDWIESR